jgi:hypothetical protein
MMDLTNEQGFPPRESGGSELLLGMHGFVGGQSQNSGRAPGLQLGPASCSMAWHAESDQGGGGTLVVDDGGPSRGWIRIA